jgi:hypothetical protein
MIDLFDGFGVHVHSYIYIIIFIIHEGHYKKQEHNPTISKIYFFYFSLFFFNN